MNNGLIHHIKVLISKNKIQEAFDKILSINQLTLEQRNNFILLLSQFNQSKRRENLSLPVQPLQDNKIILGLLRELDNLNNTVINTINSNERIEKKKLLLNKELDNLEELIQEWKQKQAISQNPSESKHCELEVKRLEKLILEVETKLESLE